MALLLFYYVVDPDAFSDQIHAQQSLEQLGHLNTEVNADNAHSGEVNECVGEGEIDAPGEHAVEHERQ